MATIENVNDRTILQQFHSLYERQNKTETDVENLDAKIDQETIDRQTADLSINTEIQTLKDQIDSLGVLFTYKGEVPTIQDLPATNNKPGDVYYVDSEQSEYIWIEKSGVYQWEQFGPAIDLSEYAKQEDLVQLKSEVDAMNTQVENNASSIVSLTNSKQNKLTAGENITIDENNVISTTVGTPHYMHNIHVYGEDTIVKFTIINTKSTAMTYEEVRQFLYTNGITSDSTSLIANGCHLNNSNSITFINSVYATLSAINILGDKITLSIDFDNKTSTISRSLIDTASSNNLLYSDTVINL